MDAQEPILVSDVTLWRNLAEMARVILEKIGSTAEFSVDDECLDGRELRHSLRSLADWVDRLPEKAEAAIVTHGFQDHVVNCAKCQGSATCWILCEAQDMVSHLVSSKAGNHSDRGSNS